MITQDNGVREPEKSARTTAGTSRNDRDDDDDNDVTNSLNSDVMMSFIALIPMSSPHARRSLLLIGP